MEQCQRARPTSRKREASPHFREESLRKRSRLCAPRVSFCRSAKLHDGLKVDSRVLEEFIECYFVKRKVPALLNSSTAGCAAGAMPVARSGVNVCETLWSDLGKVCNRIAESSAMSRVPLLEHGGGKGIMLSKEHLPACLMLSSMVRRRIDECMKSAGISVFPSAVMLA